MSWTLILPAVASLTTVATLALCLRAVEIEAALLRVSLRRSVATAVAADDLRREANRVRVRAQQTRADASARLAVRPSRWLWTDQGR